MGFLIVGPQVQLGIAEKALDIYMTPGLKHALIRAALVWICF